MWFKSERPLGTLSATQLAMQLETEFRKGVPTSVPIRRDRDYIQVDIGKYGVPESEVVSWLSRRGYARSEEPAASV